MLYRGQCERHPDLGSDQVDDHQEIRSFLRDSRGETRVEGYLDQAFTNNGTLGGESDKRIVGKLCDADAGCTGKPMAGGQSDH